MAACGARVAAGLEATLDEGALGVAVVEGLEDDEDTADDVELGVVGAAETGVADTACCVTALVVGVGAGIAA